MWGWVMQVFIGHRRDGDFKDDRKWGGQWEVLS